MEGVDKEESTTATSPETILSIFHKVSTEFPGKGSITGAFVIAKSESELILWWRSYPDLRPRAINRSVSDEKMEVVLKTSNIQKIMINYHDRDSYILINTISPSNMYQFSFASGSALQLLNMAQILALNSHPQQSLSDSLDFITESYAGNKDQHRLIDVTVNNNKIIMPAEFGFLTGNIEFVQPDLHIMSQFNIHAEDFTNNPITVEELPKFKSLDSLKEAARKRGVLPDARAYVWPIIFNILPFEKTKSPEVLKQRTEEYLSLREQWKSMSKTQLKYKNLVRDAFSTIRVDVKRTHPPDVLVNVPDWNLILIRILRTFTMWNLDVRYTQGLNDLAVNIMIVFIPAIGTVYTADEAEALVFWCFAAFVELIGSGLIADNMMVMQDRELKQIMSIIDTFHPACSKWLLSNGLGDLSFLISSFILAYGRSFEQKSIARVWEALVTVEAPWLFLRYFSASLLIMSFPSFQKIPNCSTGKLVSLMDKIFLQQDVGAIIGISLSMMANSKDAVRVEIKNREHRNVYQKDVSGQKKLFEPTQKYTNCYTENKLFA